VTLGRAVGELRIVTSGLKPGDRIVTAGLQKVKPGDRVTPKAADARISTAELAQLQPTG
jgi:multidrug efflux pump subunit AcrA (membrane-fusion protein)